MDELVNWCMRTIVWIAERDYDLAGNWPTSVSEADQFLRP